MSDQVSIFKLDIKVRCIECSLTYFLLTFIASLPTARIRNTHTYAKRVCEPPQFRLKIYTHFIQPMYKGHIHT